MNEYIFTMSCPDRLGVVARVSEVFYRHGAFITEVSNYSDPATQRFFMRFVFDDRQLACSIAEFAAHIAQLRDEWALDFQFRARDDQLRVLFAVSKYDHCLNALLHKWKAGVLPVDVRGVVSNHEDCRALVDWYGIPYHYLPVSPDTRHSQETAIMGLIDSERVDLLVLARYMQILSDPTCTALRGRAINIHHSFLPGFKGAKPYHQAYERGVKVIGATAHYVTSELDEGPIIAQEVKPVDHNVSVEQMIHIGHDIEASALTQAVRLHAEQRVVLNGQRTVIL